MWLVGWTPENTGSNRRVIWPFFPCTDITMSWTFLYRSSDCFSSSIFRSCKNKTRTPKWGEAFRRRAESHTNQSSTFSSLAAISDSTAFFILCTSTSSEDRKIKRTVVSVQGRRGSLRGLNTFRPDGVMLRAAVCSNITATVWAFFFFSNWYTVLLYEPVDFTFHFSRTFSLFRAHLLWQGSLSSHTAALFKPFVHRLIVSE